MSGCVRSPNATPYLQKAASKKHSLSSCVRIGGAELGFGTAVSVQLPCPCPREPAVHLRLKGRSALTLSIFPLHYFPMENTRNRRYRARCLRSGRRSCLSTCILQRVGTAGVQQSCWDAVCCVCCHTDRPRKSPISILTAPFKIISGDEVSNFKTKFTP